MNKQISLNFSKASVEINCLYSGTLHGSQGIKSLSRILLEKSEPSLKFLDRLKKKYA